MVNYMRIVFVGHVDHGKSTLIGRLLFDTSSLPKDKIQDVEKKCNRLGKKFEFAFLLDALEEEQEQTVTMDTTQVFFRSKKRDYIIIDAPGHKDFLKNMITGASTAETAILVIDAKEGIQEQTNRHTYLLNLLGIKNIIVVINKMDLIGYSEERFVKLSEKLNTLLSKFDMEYYRIIPISAMEGDNISKKSIKMKWYTGLNILECLDKFKLVRSIELPLRFSVQDVYNWSKRIIAGRVESGKITVGDKVIFCPSMKETKVKTIEKWNSQHKKAIEEECVGITLEEPIFIERGEISCHKDKQLVITQEFKAKVFWMGRKPLSVNQKYKLKLTTEETECRVILINKRMNPSTLEVIQEKASELLNTEVGELVIATTKPIALDKFSEITKTGRFVIVDGYEVCGGGVVVEPLGSLKGTGTS